MSYKTLLISIALLACIAYFVVRSAQKPNYESTAKNEVMDPTINSEKAPAELESSKIATTQTTKSVEPDTRTKDQKTNKDRSSPSNPDKTRTPSSPAQPGYQRLFGLLSKELSEQGFSPLVHECLERKIEGNLAREKPRIIEEMSDHCIAETGTDDSSKEKLYKGFKASIAESQNDVDLKAWHARAIKRTFLSESECFRSTYLHGVNSFASEHKAQNEIMKSSEFQKSWNAEARTLIDSVLKNCPSGDSNSINNIYAYEC